VRFKPFARDFLEEASRCGLPLAIATSSPRVLIDVFLEAQGAESLISVICCCDDLDTTKEHPTVYLEAARRLGAPIEQCLIFEDAMPSLHTAKRTGAKIVAVCERYTRQDEDEMARIADLVIPDYRNALSGHGA
jgi:HAD superfamily hydrolase (TIGR01509 family)